VQLKNKAVGDVLPMAGATFAEPLAPDSKTPTRVRFATDNEKPVGQWNFCDIICRNDMIEIHLNGVLTNRVTQVTPHSGRIGFQLEGVPFELRHIRIEPAKAAIIGTYQFPPLPLPARK
jgi:allophanate hydrolase subunit 2